MGYQNTSPMFEEYPDVVGIEDLCKMLGIGQKLTYRILRENKIPSLRIGREYKIAKIDVINFILQRGQPFEE